MNSLLVAILLSAGDTHEDIVMSIVRMVTKEQTHYLVGEIRIIGNDDTFQSVILDELNLYSGGRVRYWRLLLAECRLAALGIFEVDPIRGIRPRVRASRPFGEFRSLEVTVVEKASVRHSR